MWDNAAETLPIEVNQQVSNVTINLSSTLNHLLLAGKERFLWIDSICINENDTNEVNQHVRFMDEIYKSAHKVITWLGPKTEYSSRALELLQLLVESVHASESPPWHNPTTGTLFSDSELVQIFLPLLNSKTTKSSIREVKRSEMAIKQLPPS